MALPGVNFESSKLKDQERQQKRQARQEYLAKAKKDHERQQRKDEEKRKRGEMDWMLPSVSQRLKDESEPKKSKKEKKHKKEKKKKKKKDKDSEKSDSGDEWVEKKNDIPSANPLKGPTLQRDDWMSAPADLIPTITRDQLRKVQIEKDKEEKKIANLLEQPGQHARELNPFWKDGGTGLPEEAPKKKVKRELPSVTTGDGGLGWLRKAYARCCEQAKAEGKTMEEVAADRWGSLKKLESLLADAERKNKQPDEKLDSKLKERRSRSLSTERSKRKRSRSRSKDRKRHSRSRSRDRRRSRSRRCSRSRSRDKKRRSRSRSRSRDRRRRSCSRSRSRDRRRRSCSRSRSRDRKRRSRSRSYERKIKSKSRFMKPGDYDESTKSSHKERSSDKGSSWRKPGFKKPGSDSDRDAENNRDKRHFKKPDVEDEVNRTRQSKVNCDEIPKTGSSWKKESKKFSPEQRKSMDSSSEDSSSDSASESESEEEVSKEPPPRKFSEDEMNALGAKILKAEIMGDDELASELKEKLEQARVNNEKIDRMRKENPSAFAEDDTNVVLTKTDKRGVVRPVSGSFEPGQPRGRKKEKAATHGKDGKRDRYFVDDDRYDLKALVNKERFTSAEDQNIEFAKLAAKGAKPSNDDEYQLDDMFVERANKQDSKSTKEMKERSAAIGQHQKMTGALEKCTHCIEKCSKHLIIALGTKSYLCVPSHRSMDEGHCLIVPMQHLPAGTAMDEDVWEEMQIFRKCLVNMFQERGEDCVFMETVMGLHWHPHTFIECVPLPRELGDMAPIYFKKAIMDTGSEWAQNKKVVDLSNKSIRNAVPKGFPYFSVDFGLQGGYAHVIEEEKSFPRYFGREILGGMLDLDPSYWRKPHKENFEIQRKKVLKFAEMWKPYDWTQKNV